MHGTERGIDSTTLHREYLDGSIHCVSGRDATSKIPALINLG